MKVNNQNLTLLQTEKAKFINLSFYQQTFGFNTKYIEVFQKE